MGLAAAVVVLTIAIVLRRAGTSARSTAVASHAGPPGQPGVVAAARRPDEAHKRPRESTTHHTEGRQVDAPTPAVHAANLLQQTADGYRQQARYPHSSQPVGDNGEDPILRDRDVQASVFLGPNGEEPALTVFPDQISFEGPDPVRFYAYLSAQGTRVPAGTISARIIGDSGDTVAQLELNDDGRTGDAQPGDYVYTAELQLPESGNHQLSGIYSVGVVAITTDGQTTRDGATSFLYASPQAQLTGRYADTAVDGNLEVRAEIAAAAEGRFHLEATLYTQSGKPVAWAENALNLPPGEHWIPLSFYGLILHEKGEDGPYVLRFVALSTTTEMPGAKNRLVENPYVTSAYQATSFSDQPFNDPDLLAAADRLEQYVQPQELNPEGEQ